MKNDMSHSVFFSIIIPVYNREKLIEKTLQSVLKLNYERFEVVVVDDGSTDRTAEVVASFKDVRIKYFFKENGERGAARNYGIKMSSGDFITFLDSDDLVYKNHLSEANRFININPSVNFFHQGYEIIDEQNKVLRKVNKVPKIANKSLLKGNQFSCLGVFLNKKVFDEPIGFSEDRRLSIGEDWLLWLKLSARHSILANNTVTAALVNHVNRSMSEFDLSSHQFSINYLAEELSKDENFMSSFGKSAVGRIKAHMLTLTSLNAVLANEKKLAFQYFLKGISCSFQEIFSKRTLVIFKLILIQ